mgnify:CR=1 FL=1
MKTIAKGTREIYRFCEFCRQRHRYALRGVDGDESYYIGTFGKCTATILVKTYGEYDGKTS